MNSRVLDDFEDLSDWAAIASGQAELRISPERGPRGGVMRLDFDFRGGGGFVVARKPFDLTLPESYAFSFNIRGEGPCNILELKLVDGSDQNVWRWRAERFDLPDEWQPLRVKSSQIPFAWGPLGGGRARAVAAIEIVIAAGPGGQGTIWIDDLRLEDTSYYLTPLVEATSALPGWEPLHVCDPSPETRWRSSATHAPQHVTIDFQCEREYGGLIIRWERDRRPRAFDILLSRDGVEWQTCYSATEGVGEETYVFLPEAVSRFVRLDLGEPAQPRGFGIVSVEVQPYEFSASRNDLLSVVARRAHPGLYPKYLLGRQTYWTPVGTGEDVTQALCNEEGMVEVDKGAFSIEPFLWVDGGLITWADVALAQSLEQDALPIPSVEWGVSDLTLGTTAFATGPSGDSTLWIRYRLENHSDTARQLTLFAAIRPLQVTPTWQHWHGFGGVCRIGELAWRGGAVWVDRHKQILPLTPPSGFGAATFAQGGITEHLWRGELPHQDAATDTFDQASGALRFDLDLPPRAAREVYLAAPFGEADPDRPAPHAAGLSGPDQLTRAVTGWEGMLGALEIRLPPCAAGVVETLRTAAAHILINRDGPALQPGPRRYSRAWIRDGALMGAALARMGLSAESCAFIRWYAGYQAVDGNLPDCVDRDGCEWLPEFDSWGEFIFAVMDSYRFSEDRSFLAEMWPAVLKSVDYLEQLRKRRLTPAYEAPDKRACYGLLPESMSHEGYMAYPVHAYWDDFWALRGLKDAASMAGILGEPEASQRIAALRDAFQESLYASLDLVIRKRALDFVPGSVELADFDPTATAIALSVADELQRLPRRAIDQTFDKYLEGFRARAGGDTPWANYSAYEIRIIAALVRLGRRPEAHELLSFFLADRRIPPWNQWPEISWRDPLGPSFIGDMPHSWIGAEYVLAVRSLFAYEREADQSLVVAAGVAPAWLDEGGEVVVRNLPTYYGKLSYRLRRASPQSLHLQLSGDMAIPAGGVVVMPPLSGPLVRVEINGRSNDALEPELAVCRECPAEMRLHS
jgi:hypothetical protein